MLKVSNVSLVQDDKNLLSDVSCKLLPGKVTAFIGENGAGKTTLFKCMANLNKQYVGAITYGETPISSYSPQQRIQVIGYVSRSTTLFPHMTILENCMHPMIAMLKLDKKAAKTKALHLLNLLEIQELAERYPKTVSTGQQQRALIARALGLNPRVLLLDEVTAGLDPYSEEKLQQILEKLCALGTTIALSSHDMRFVKTVFDRVYFMEEGRVAERYDADTCANLQKTENIGTFLTDHAWKSSYE